MGRKLEARPASRRTETAYKARPEGEPAQHGEAHWHQGNVNAAVAQGKFTRLSGETCTTGAPSDRGAFRRETGGMIGQESAEAVVRVGFCRTLAGSGKRAADYPRMGSPHGRAERKDRPPPEWQGSVEAEPAELPPVSFGVRWICAWDLKGGADEAASPR